MLGIDLGSEGLNKMNIEYRMLEQSEIKNLRDIDRSEVIDEVYHFRNSQLVLEKEHYDMKGFKPGDLENIIEHQNTIIGNGGIVIGAFDGDVLVGVTSLEKRFRGKMKKYMKMDILFVSKNYRGKGIARTLVQMIGEQARAMGADALYISATPSKHTVEFYMSCGAKLVDELDPELFKMEPKDIHLELEIQISEGELLKRPFLIALIVGTLLEAFGGLMYTSGGEYVNPGLFLIVAGICGDLMGILLWFKAPRQIHL